MRRTAILSGLVLLATLLLPRAPAGAAGVTTHAWMALDAIDLVTDPQLEALLRANIGQVEGGAQFPDSGYWNDRFDQPGGSYGEEAHWQRFFDAYAADIRTDPSCGDLTAANGPCAPRIAHLLGAAAHGLGDEVWDWLFEPRAPDFDESYIPPDLADYFGSGGAELQMDIVAIHDHGRATAPDTPPIPDPGGLVDVFSSIGRTDITEAGLDSGKGGMSIIRWAEPIITQLYYTDIITNMANTAAGLTDAPGGVDYAAKAIAALYENLWRRVTGEPPLTRIGATYPADGETDVPTTGWERASFRPGASPSGGGARNRISATLTYALPYVPRADEPGSVPTQLPAGAMTLTETATGTAVPIKSGYPKAVPYGPNRGEHTIDIQPQADLAPCTEYRVDVTDHLLDHEGRGVVPASWTFETDGCPPEPTTGSVTIIKEASPANGQNFSFTGCGPLGCGSFDLDDDDDPALPDRITFAGIAPATYTITEAATPGWQLSDLTCDTGESIDLSARRATVTLAAGEHVTCTFTNRHALGGTP